VSKTFYGSAGSAFHKSLTTHLREVRQMSDVGNFEGSFNFELGSDISRDVNVWYLDVAQGLAGPCNSETSSEGYLCVDCSLIRRGIVQH